METNEPGFIEMNTITKLKREFFFALAPFIHLILEDKILSPEASLFPVNHVYNFSLRKTMLYRFIILRIAVYRSS